MFYGHHNSTFQPSPFTNNLFCQKTMLQEHVLKVGRRRTWLEPGTPPPTSLSLCSRKLQGQLSSKGGAQPWRPPATPLVTRREHEDAGGDSPWTYILALGKHTKVIPVELQLGPQQVLQLL